MRRLVLAAALMTMWAVQGSAFAQSSPNVGNTSSGPYANPSGNGTPQPGEGEQRGDWDKVYQGTSQAKPGKSLTPKLQALQDAAAAVLASNLPCVPTDALDVAQGPAVINGRTIQTTTFEISCSNGMGYFVTS